MVTGYKSAQLLPDLWKMPRVAWREYRRLSTMWAHPRKCSLHSFYDSQKTTLCHRFVYLRVKSDQNPWKIDTPYYLSGFFNHSPDHPIHKSLSSYWPFCFWMCLSWMNPLKGAKPVPGPTITTGVTDLKGRRNWVLRTKIGMRGMSPSATQQSVEKNSLKNLQEKFAQ